MDDDTEIKPPDYVKRQYEAFTIVEAEDGSILQSSVEVEDARRDGA